MLLFLFLTKGGEQAILYLQNTEKRAPLHEQLRKDADGIREESIRAVLPDRAVQRALKDFEEGRRTILVSVGKAAYQMAAAHCRRWVG